MTSQLHQDLGFVQGGLKAVEDRLKKVEQVLEKIDERLAANDQRESERRGAWKTLLALAGVVGAFAGALVKYFMG